MAGIYIHVPFCHSKCAYCDFYSMPLKGREEKYAGYTDALLNEWEHRHGELDQPVRTIYFGGGTPSSLPLTQLDRIISVLPVGRGGETMDEAADIEMTMEVTMEVNPEDVTGEFCEWLRRSPVNRVSMGVQSLNDRELSVIGRRHTAREAVEAYKRLRDASIENISLDLIYGLPKQSLESWRESLISLLDMRPEHLSAYLLSYEEGTRLTAMRSAGKVAEATQELAEEMYATLCSLTHTRGYEHYEISNFALPGRRSRHNSSYWRGVPYLGLGPSAHSLTMGDRSYNPSSLRDYIAANGVVNVVEHESETEKINDLILTALRTKEGLRLSDFTPARRERLMRAASPWVSSRALRLEDGYLRMDEAHWLISDRVIVDLIEVY